MIFAGNFIISINNFKNYLESESTTKSQDTATSLGMTLKSLISNKTDPEIKSTISAIANRGFYKEIRLEDIEFSFTQEELLSYNNNFDTSYSIKDISININDGEIVSSASEDDLANELSTLEGDVVELDDNNQITYSFIPSKTFPNNKTLTINYSVYKDNVTKITSSKIDINKVLVKVTREEKFDNVPQWFIDYLPMTMVETKSEISDGWKIQAIIYVSANAGEAYAQLFEQAKSSLYYAIISFSISFILLIIFLRFILQPLRAIDKLAKNITEGKFNTIEKLPWTLELKNVSISMNYMSDTIKNIISKLNTNLEKLTEQLSQDELTGLQQEQTFNTDMKQMFIKKQTGYVLSIRIDNFADFAKNNQHKVVDKFLKEFAYILKDEDTKVTAYRFFGSTFAMISKHSTEEEIKKLVIKLKNAFDKLGEKYKLTTIAHIGVTPFNPISTTDDILALANEAYETSKQIGANEFYIRDKDDLARDMLEWKELIFDIIDNKKFGLKYINQSLQTYSGKDILLEEAFTFAIDKKEKIIPIGTFISIAEEYKKIVDFDKAVVTKVIEYVTKQNIKHEILINLAFDSLMDDAFKIWLESTLSRHKNVSNKLVFSVTAYGCVRDIEAFKVFISLVHKNGAKVILKRFETKFIPLDSLKEFNLDYIRLARDYTNSINSDKSKQSFVESICELSKLLNIKVFAESVKDEENFTIVKSLGVHGISK